MSTSLAILHNAPSHVKHIIHNKRDFVHVALTFHYGIINAINDLSINYMSINSIFITNVCFLYSSLLSTIISCSCVLLASQRLGFVYHFK